MEEWEDIEIDLSVDDSKLLVMDGLDIAIGSTGIPKNENEVIIDEELRTVKLTGRQVQDLMSLSAMRLLKEEMENKG